jgi:hypothetical protein
MKRNERTACASVSAMFYLTIITSQKCNGFISSPMVKRSSSSIPFVTKQKQTFLHDNNNYTPTVSSTCSFTRISTRINLQAPPGSGYFTEDEAESFFPDTYEPMMEYPGTMRPGRKPENQPYSSLPIQETDPEPVPWPHFQEIEWHHNWGSPHEAPIPMEEFIDMHGRWATAEMEAEMRAGARRGVRERRELEEAQKAASFILDDDEDDDEEDDGGGTKLDLGEGVDALIGAAAAATIAKPSAKPDDSAVQVDDDDDDDDGDNFLLDLGLDEVDDTEDDDEEDESEEDGDDDGEEPAFATGDDGAEGILEAMQSIIDAEDGTAAGEAGSENEIDIDFDDLGLNFDDDEEDDDEEEEATDESGSNAGEEEFVVMDDDDISMENEDLTLDEMIGNEDMGADDEFDDGGFDYD